MQGSNLRLKPATDIQDESPGAEGKSVEAHGKRTLNK